MWDTFFAIWNPKRNVNFRRQSLFCENGYTQFERPAVFDERLVENGWEKKSRLLTSLKKKNKEHRSYTTAVCCRYAW